MSATTKNGNSAVEEQTYDLDLTVFENSRRMSRIIPAAELVSFLEGFRFTVDEWGKVCPDPGDFESRCGKDGYLVICAVDYDTFQVFLCVSQLDYLDLLQFILPILRDVRVLALFDSWHQNTHESVRSGTTTGPDGKVRTQWDSRYHPEWDADNLFINLDRIASALEESR